MNRRADIGLVIVSLLAGSGVWLGSVRQDDSKPSPQDPSMEQQQEEDFAPIDDMHHFMEYVCQPGYRRIRESLANEPADRRAWRPIKADTMVLAESSFLYAERYPEGATDDQKAQWREMSLDVHRAGRELYNAIGDFEKSRAAFDTLVDNCNRCHDAFEEGRHHLEK